MKRSALVIALGVFVAFASTAFAVDPGGKEPAYLDDRSTGKTLIRSLYNAIDRHEYLRAWSYFGENADRPDYASFARGYENTRDVRLKLGKATAEGAAGSLYTNVPVAIEATDEDGTTAVFSGCYVTRLVQPAVQATPPFEPLHIEKATLKRLSESLDAVEPTCPDA